MKLKKLTYLNLLLRFKIYERAEIVQEIKEYIKEI